MISVVIIDDHLALRHAIAQLLQSEPELAVIGVAGEAATGFDMVMKRRPNVVIADLRLPDESGAELTRRLLAADPDIGVLLYTGEQEGELLASALDCGARGFALKAGDFRELRAAIEAVARGEGYVDPRIRSTILARRTTERISVLSRRERQILDLLSRGLTGEAIAQELFLSPETVRTHTRNAMTKLQARTRAHAIAIALGQGDIPHLEPDGSV